MAVDVKALLKQAQDNKVLDDQSQNVTSEDFNRLPAAGLTVTRLVEYVELGAQKQRAYKGKDKPDAAMARITFELLGPKNKHEVTAEGSSEAKVFYDRMSMNVKISKNTKSRFKKLFNKMVYGRQDITHMAQMLGDAFVVTVYHNEVGEGDQKKTYANLDKDGEWSVEPPYKDDPMTGTRHAYAVPAPQSELKVFLQVIPTKETWDSLFIEGTRTRKNEKGEEVEVSKNFLQNTILAASDFKGSPLEQMLTGLGGLPTFDQEAVLDVSADEEAEAAHAGDKAAPASAEKPKATTGDDALALLGLGDEIPL